MPSTLPQPGILAFGTTHHIYLTLDLIVEPTCDVLTSIVSCIDKSLQTGVGGMTVIGFRPELWARLVPEHALPGLTGFNEPLVGPDGYSLPATQHDIVLWLQGGAQDALFDLGRQILFETSAWLKLANETTGWVYHHHRDLTGFVDGTENPHQFEIPDIVRIPDGPASGGSVLLLQRWKHDSAAWEALAVSAQEQVMGRSKEDDVEFEHKAVTAHIARTDQDVLGDMLRRNTSYGTISNHGTMFVGVAKSRDLMHNMLLRMVGIDGPRDALTKFSCPETGGYYYLPSVDQLEPFQAHDED